MKCIVCKQGDVVAGKTTVTLERGGTTLVVKAVPAGVCANCGEEYLTEEVSGQLMELAEVAARTGVQMQIRQFAAA